jgi:hypothetical protein
LVEAPLPRAPVERLDFRAVEPDFRAEAPDLRADAPDLRPDAPPRAAAFPRLAAPFAFPPERAPPPRFAARPACFFFLAMG